jgi:hypothetical protein
MLMSMEAVASREVVRLGNQLLEFETEERNRPLRGLPEKLLKTKGRKIKVDQDADEHGSSRLTGGRAAQQSTSRIQNGRTKTSLAGITREVAENKGTAFWGRRGFASSSLPETRLLRILGLFVREPLSVLCRSKSAVLSRAYVHFL